MVGLLDHCRFGPGGAAPSIDTPLHGFLPAAHVDHLHPDAVIAFATAADGASASKEAFGGEVGWLPGSGPASTSALRLRDLVAGAPDLQGVVLGGHGLISWAETSDGVPSAARCR